MNNRDIELLDLRPKIPGAGLNATMSPEERFQNETLRPVAKLQNDLLLAAFRNYIAKHKNVFHTLTLEKRMGYIENAIQRDIKFRNSLKGMIMGQFTMSEYSTYIKKSSALNKRMMNIVKERLLSQMQLLEEEAVAM